MRYFDCHVHLQSADAPGFEGFLGFIGSRPNLVGCNLVLNTSEEHKVVSERMDRLPANVVIVPSLPLEFVVPQSLAASRWWKVHPTLHRISRDRIPDVIRLVGSLDAVGIMVHHFPWGDRLEYNVGLELVIELARSFPSLPIVATHGGGYESWALRAHTARLPNVYYDFSVTFSVYRGTDFVRPWSQYVERRRSRILFGSDWPSADPEPQLAEAIRIAEEAGISSGDLERHLLDNANTLWPLAGSQESPTVS